MQCSKLPKTGDVKLNSDVRQDLSDSIYDFRRLVLPVIESEQLLGGQIVSIEEATAEDGMDFVRNMDNLAGIDLVRLTPMGMSGIANRLQWVSNGMPYDSFTIRLSRTTGAMTEYEKRKKAIESGGRFLYPHITIQSYVTEPRRGGCLLSFAIALTRDIIQLCETATVKTNPQDGNEFYIVWWRQLQNTNRRVTVHHQVTAGIK